MSTTLNMVMGRRHTLSRTRTWTHTRMHPRTRRHTTILIPLSGPGRGLVHVRRHGRSYHKQGRVRRRALVCAFISMTCVIYQMRIMKLI
jgi:hypothetical protein